MKNLLFSFFALLSFSTLYSQYRFSSISLSNINFLMTQVFSQDSLANVDTIDQNYLTEDTDEHLNDSKAQLFETEIISDWLRSNPNVRIVRQSEYMQLTAEERKLYLEKKYLILKGEELRIEDIYNY